jgi:uncharacterized membrane protein YfcA
VDVSGDWILPAAPVGLLIGAWAGFSGYSGWPLVVPMLLVMGGRPLHESLAASMFVDWLSASSASLVYGLRGDADVATAGRWGFVSVPLVLAGAGLSFLLLPRFEGLLHGGVGPIAIALGAALWLRAARLRAAPQVAAATGVPVTLVVAGEDENGSPRLSPGVSRALLGGGMSVTAGGMGLIGMGGGFAAAMLLILLRGDETRRGVATGLLFTALVLPVALLVYLWMLPDGIGFWPVLLPFAACSAVGAGLSAWQSAAIPSRHLGFVVAGCVLAAGVAATLQRWAMA